MNKINDRKRGCLYGLAIGDALGAAVEFRAPGEFEPVTGYRGLGPHNIEPGQWTDDTSMALALADSIGRGWDLADQLKNYCLWWEEGRFSVNGWCFDIGCTTKTALWKFLETKDPLTSGATSVDASGNGSIMRLAPVPIKYADLFHTDPAFLMNLADQSSLTTHNTDQCKSACRYLAMALAALIHGEDRAVLDEPIFPLDQMALCPEIEAVARGSFRTKDQVVGTGWVVESLEAALWAFQGATDFEDAVLRAVNLGLDADTTGAVAGQLAGAFWGYSGIPTHLIDGLDRKDMIEAALTSLGVPNAAETAQD